MRGKNIEETGNFIFRKCSYYRVNNFYTNGESCPVSFDRYLLHNSTQYEQTFYERCKSCGFLWLDTCCKQYPLGIGQRDTVLYTCNKSNKLKTSLDVLKVDSTFVYGGSFTSKSVNPLTGSATCPQMFSPVGINDQINVCFTKRTIDTKEFPFFGGFYSCTEGNAELDSNEQKCPEGYSTYVMGIIDTDCLLYVCLKFRNFDHGNLPPIALPPFFEIDLGNQTETVDSDTGNSLDGTTTTRAKTDTGSDKKVTIGISIAALVVSLLGVLAFIVFLINKRQRTSANRIYRSHELVERTPTNTYITQHSF